MALRAVEEWSDWLSDLPLTNEVITKYATEFKKAEMTEYDLTEFTHELLKELNISIPGHRTKILKKARLTSTSSMESSTIVRKSDIKLPSITKNCSTSEFRKFLIDWDIYKTESRLQGSQCNKLLYSACDKALQNNIINGMPKFQESSEEQLIQYIKDKATELSNPTVYRLGFHHMDPLEHQTNEQYLDA